MSTERHDIVLGVGADVTRARMELESLQKIADRLRATLGGSGGGPGMPVGTGGVGASMPAPPPPGSPGGAQGMGGNSSTTQSGVAVANPLPPRDANGRFTSPNAPNPSPAYVPPTVQSGSTNTPSSSTSSSGSSSTKSSGSLWSGDDIRRFARENQGADDTTKRLNPDRNGPGAGYGTDGMASAAIRTSAGAIASGSTQGVVSGVAGFAGAAVGGWMGSAIAAMGTVSGLGPLDENTRARSRMERDFGLSQLAGFGQDSVERRRQQISKDDPTFNAPNPFKSYSEDEFAALNRSNYTEYSERVSGLSRYVTKAAGIGVNYSEAIASANAYTRAAGGLISDPREDTLIDATLAGISSSTIGAHDRSRYVGGATGSADSAMRLAGVGQQGFGMYGGLDQWLQQFTSQFDRLISRGMKIDHDSVNEFMERMAGNSVLSGLGDKAAAVYGGFRDSGRSASDRITGQFGSIMDNVALAEAAKGGGSLMDIVKRARSMEPEQLRGAMNGMLGPEVAALSYLGKMGELTPEQAEALAGPLAAGKSFDVNGQSAETYRRQKIIEERNTKNVTDGFRFYDPDRQERVSKETEKMVELTTDIGQGMWVAADALTDIMRMIKEGNGLRPLNIRGVEQPYGMPFYEMGTTNND